MSNPLAPRTNPTAPHHGDFTGKLSSSSVAENTRSSSADASVAHHDYDSFARPSAPPDAHPIPFQSKTIAPSPPPESDSNSSDISMISHGETSQDSSSSALRISTDVGPSVFTPPQRRGSLNGGSSLSSRGSASLNRKTSSSNLQPTRTPSFKTALAQALEGPASGASSVVASPILSAMGDMTPLPSPLMSADSPGPWKKLTSGTPPRSRDRLGSVGEDSVLRSSLADPSSMDASATSAPRRKMYTSLEPPDHPSTLAPRQKLTQHTRNRSASEYMPEPVAVPKRHITVSGSHGKPDPAKAQEPHIRREVNLAESRGLRPTVEKPPTPPPSESSKDSTDGSNRSRDPKVELFEARDRHDKKKRRWRALRSLGQGTFSQVVLATSQIGPNDDESVESLPDRKTLVAVKICEHGPRGGASEDRIEMSLKRELEILQSIHHPSLVDLKAFSIEPTRAILVLTYSPGGDLFDVATAHRPLLTPPLMRRVFAELVGAVEYLHEQRIVHRDIKLENVLVNLATDELADPTIDWTTYPNSVTTLADLGLSRRITDDEKLETRCGSDDYAAPEVVMGQPYDGRATDAWSLGVLLYALLEARLPFDPHPGMSDAHRMRSRTSHRIARVEWRWVEYAGDDGDHEGDEARFRDKDLLGAMTITEGLLKRARSRWTLAKVAQTPWTRDAIAVDGGLKFWEEQEGQEVL